MAASVHLLHHLLSKTPTSSSSIFLKSFYITTAFHLHKPFRTIKTSPLSLPSSPLSLFLNSSSSSSCLSHTLAISPRVLLNEDTEFDLHTEDEVEEDGDGEEEEEEEVIDEELESADSSSSTINGNSALEIPSLSVKEKKELASYAHSLGKKLKAQQVGKSGVTSSLAAAFVENLESNELLKLKIHNSCPGEFADVVKQLEETTGSVAVGQIGRSVILYRPSLTKLKAAEKKKQHYRAYIRKPKPTESKRVELLKLSGRGRRGSSRV